jgi:sugar-specific transcriptional regulator TrmB
MSVKFNLRELGFNEKEQAVYLTLFKHGPLSPSQLAKLTRINRPTVYNVAESLKAKGVVDTEAGNKTTIYLPLPPEHLLNLVDKPMRELEERKQLIRQTVDELKTLKASTTYPVPKIRFIEQQGLEDFLYSNIATWQESVKKTDHTWWGIQDYTFLKHFGKFNDWYWSQPISEGVRMCQIGNESEEETRLLRRIKKQTRDVRFSSDMLFTSSVWVGGEYLIMIFTRQQPFYLVEIHDAMLASNMREVFKKLWQGYQTNR